LGASSKGRKNIDAIMWVQGRGIEITVDRGLIDQIAALPPDSRECGMQALQFITKFTEVGCVNEQFGLTHGCSGGSEQVDLYR
jgi:hypothetical protein